MPDWVAHLALGFLAGKAAKVRDISLVLAGSLIPDLGRILEFLPLSPRDIMALAIPFHSIAVSALIAGALASLVFRKADLKYAFSLLMSGAALHLALDAMMMYTIGGVVPLAPISYARFSAELFPSESFVPAMVLSLAVACYLAYKKFKKA